MEYTYTNDIVINRDGCENDEAATRKQVADCGLDIIELEDARTLTRGGYPSITVRGTRKQLIDWVRKHYGCPNLSNDELAAASDDRIWESMQNEGGIVAEVAHGFV